MAQLYSHWTDFHEISYFMAFRKSVDEIQNLTFFLPCIMQWFLLIVQLDAQIPFNIFIYSSLHVSSMSCSSSGETDCINTASGKCHSVLVAVSCEHDTATNTERQLPEVVLTEFVSPDDEHDVLETCRVKSKNEYIERNLCVTLVIYQKSRYVSLYNPSYFMNVKPKFLCSL